MPKKTKFGFGSSSAVLQALQDGKINARDILLLDENTSAPKFGWVNLQNEPVIIDTEQVVVVESESLPESGEEGKIYIFNEDGYFWNGTEFVNLCKPTDVSELKTQVAGLETEMETKVDAETVQTMIKEYSDSVIEVVEF